MGRQKIRYKVKAQKSEKKIWLNAGLAQFMVIFNGFLLSVTAFLILMLFIEGMSKDEYRRSAEAAGGVFADKILKLENAIHIVSGILQLSDNPYRENTPELIRRNVAGLSAFDQVLWVFEAKPGKWQYRVIFETAEQDYLKDDYKLIPNQALISKIVNERLFEQTSLRVMLDFPKMTFGPDKKNGNVGHTPFALVKTIEKGNSAKGIIIGISRPGFLLDDKWIKGVSAIGRLTIRDVNNQKKLYTLDHTKSMKADVDFSQDYNLYVGDTQWKINLEFIKKSNVLALEAIPYMALFFGAMLTVVGALFVRSNQNQSKRLAAVNQVLEQKNFELENEVSARARLNHTLEKVGRDNRAIIDSVSDIIFETDTSGKILFLSAAWRKITGFDPEHSIGNNLFSLLHPEEQERQKQDFALLVSGQKHSYRAFARLRISDGTFRAVEIAISMIRQDENKTLKVVGTITDVEERRRAERALAEAEKKYRAIVENAAGGLYQVTPDGMYLNVNPAMARILGYGSVEEMLRTIKNVNGTVYPDIKERNGFIQELTTAGRVLGHETQILKKDGTLIWINENVRVVRDDQQNILYFEGSMEDVTKRKEADIALLEAKLQSDMANRAKTEFIANMSHELRTPLNAIIGFSEIIKNEVMGPVGQSSYAEYAGDIHQSGKNLLKVINEILDISQIEAGKRDLKEREFAFDRVLKTTLDFYESKLREKRIILTNGAERLPVIMGEELAIKQVLGNIYSNAIKFTPEGGRIVLSSGYEPDGSFKFVISDTGVGMTQREIEKAVSPFGQIENAHDRSGSGTGLGLPLAQSIIALHGGHIEIISEKGIGTSVAIVVPAQRIINADKNVTQPQNV